MTQTKIQKTFAPFKTYLPKWASNLIRNVVTAVFTPILTSYRTGHFVSSLKMVAVSKGGDPLPWYTYPCIDFLRYRSFKGKTVLEFGGGQSTIWWAGRASSVVVFEGDRNWYNKLKTEIPRNVDLHYVSPDDGGACVREIKNILTKRSVQSYDVVIIDGLNRYDLIGIAQDRVSADGIIICDDAEGYGFYDGFKNSGFNRVDFFGNAPAVILPHATSIFFRGSAFVFDPKHPIPTVAHE